MSTFLDDLLLRNLREDAVIRPRLPSRFEAQGVDLEAGELGSMGLTEPIGIPEDESRELPMRVPAAPALRPHVPEPLQPVAVERRRVQPVDDDAPVLPRQPAATSSQASAPGAARMETTVEVAPPVQGRVAGRVERQEPAPPVEPLPVTPPALSPAPEPSPKVIAKGNAPVALKEPPREASASSPVSVRVHIGRIEVQTPQPAPRPEPQRTPVARTAAPLRPAVSLDQYLTRRGRQR